MRYTSKDAGGVTEADIEEFERTRQNTRESNHRYTDANGNDEDFMDMILRGATMDVERDKWLFS